MQESSQIGQPGHESKKEPRQVSAAIQATDETKETELGINPASLEQDTAEEAYSVYTPTEKWLIVCLVAIAGLFSPLPANIYFPAIPLLADTFGTSIELMNQTVTVYLVMQGLCM